MQGAGRGMGGALFGRAVTTLHRPTAGACMRPKQLLQVAWNQMAMGGLEGSAAIAS